MTTMLQETRPLPAPGPAPTPDAGRFPHTVPGADDARRGELAAFLRSRRERVTPEQAGLPRGPRRRTPGLRREEVAHLAAVGVTWYTWLEQARDIKVSAQVLDSIARALMLDRVERSHLFALAGTADPMPDTSCLGVSEELRMMLERLEPFPACVQNARYDIRAYNRAYGQLMCDLDSLPVEEHNCMWIAFTQARISGTFVDRAAVIQSMAAKFRASMAEHIADPAWNCLLKRLLDASPEFRALWARHEVAPPAARTTRVFQHPRAGLLRLNHTSLWVGPQSGARLVTFVPADGETRERLERLR
ncbi:helix-turn-helix transcriptional regulator [Streptomyces albireticuli]|uniref:helix-turn-helix transcriptional regulator n=1 Tax=Streptomyces albireticuli TaxID=1940 RepID=UPI0036797308